MIALCTAIFVVVHGDLINAQDRSISTNDGPIYREIVQVYNNKNNIMRDIYMKSIAETLELRYSGDSNISQNISGYGRVIKEGVGKLTLSGKNTYKGGTWVSDGQIIGTTDSLQGGFHNRQHTALIFDQEFGGEFKGIINGPGKVIVKNGQIKFNWSNSRAQIGSMEIEGGHVILNSKMNINNVIIHQSGTLSGIGTIAREMAEKTQVINSGIVSPGNSLGTLRIQGDYQQTAGGKLVIEIAEKGHDKLEVQGKATLDGTLQVKTDGYVPPGGKEFTVVEATEGVKGKFAKEELEKLQGPLKFKVLYEDPATGKTVKVATVEEKFEGITPPQKEVANALNEAVAEGKARGELGEAILALKSIPQKEQTLLPKQPIPPQEEQAPPPEQPIPPQKEQVPYLEQLTSTQEEQAPYLEQFIPTLAISLKEVFFNAANVQYAQLADRLGTVREGVSGMSLNGLSQEPMAQQMNSHEAKFIKRGPIMESLESSPWKIFANASGIFSKINTAADLPRQNAMTGYFSIGGDYRLNKHISIGVYSGYQGIRSWYEDGSWLKSNGVKFGLYGTGEWNHFYVNALVGGGFSGVELKRTIYMGEKQWMAGSRPTVWELNSLLGGGYELPLGPWRIGVNNSIQYTYLGISNFKESGVGNLGLKVGRQNPSSLVYTLGGSIAYRWELADNYAIMPKVGLSWQHEFLNYGETISAEFLNGPNFRLASATGARNNAFGTAGCIAQLGRHVTAYGYYNPQFGGGDIVSHAFLIGLNYNF